ncbi:RHS repeat-associated protein [Pedobacter sp. W3I1]|uniref:DUF6443 domain-containing protein n=1 Tax=Pedobacter sp. W3I1 TaxID=3042291 RepID=UPI0027800C0C|nr:DUF6443 domain-containing protein [Pedobacter sp. W3I1]MDQ0639308.1 RHS repeat-associated protein [Pedobacter sp. W3I1]
MNTTLKYIIIVTLLICYGASVSAQQQLTLNNYSGQSEIRARDSVVMKDGFTIPYGSSVRIYTGASFGSCTPLVSQPSASQNYVLTRSFKIAGVTEQTLNTSRGICEENQVVAYLDGLGRPLQTVTIQGSPEGKDIIQPYAYDAFSRESQKFQPYSSPGNGGAYRSSPLTEQQSFYNNPPLGVKNTNSPYSLTIFEASPLNRILGQGAPGDAWQPAAGHGMKMEYGSNALDEVKLWSINSGNNGAVSTTCQPGRLYKTISKDENWKDTDGRGGITEEFKDIEGKMILKRVWETNTKSLSTYYIHDDLGNLRYVLPPAVNENGLSMISSFDEGEAVFNKFIYGYHYDERNRLIEKKIPGSGWSYMVYNKRNQLVLSQDANQHLTAQWIFNKYDALGHTITTGIYSSGSIRDSLQASVNREAGLYPLWETRTVNSDYTDVSFPRGITDYLTKSYYDSYDFPENSFGMPTAVQATEGQANGLLTGTLVSTLGSTQKLLTVHYYDQEGRILQSKAQHHLGGADVVDNTYSFVDELTASIRTHVANGVTTVIANRYEYDHMGRKLATMKSINGAAEIVLNKLDYNEIGQIRGKSLHSADNGVTFLQHTNFAYNERGWMTNSISSEFNMELKYNNGTTPQYNGNISNQLFANGGNNTFVYSYDKLNRLIQSTAGNSLGERIRYDVMGNIDSLTRDGYGTNTYTGYDGNKLTAISGFVNSTYTYDVNGNLKSDVQKGITDISYNYLNLPQTITGKGLTYTYDATGEKLSKQSPAGTINYIDGIQYKADGTIDFILTGEGLARRNGTEYTYEYNLTDHLGNVRVTFYKNPTTGQLEVLQRDDYYAFGLRKDPVVIAGTNKYLYNGKELQEELNEYDYGARFYDPVIGRWNVIDPLSVIYEASSPYVYGSSNPITFVDPDGRSTEDWMNEHGLTDKDVTNVYKANDENNGNDDVPKQKNTSNLGQSFIDGIMAGINSTIEGVKDQFTVKGYLKGLGNTVTFGAISSGDMLIGAYQAAKNIPNYTANDYAHGAGFATEKVGEYFVTKKAGSLFKGKIPTTSEILTNSPLSSSEELRIQNAADRIKKSITVVGSRASGKAGAYSDWDYVIPGMTSKNWSTIKNSLPGAKSYDDLMPRNIDVFKGPVRVNEPHITINPRKK